MRISDIFIHNMNSIVDFTDHLYSEFEGVPVCRRYINGQYNTGCSTILSGMETLSHVFRTPVIKLTVASDAEVMVKGSWCGITIHFTDKEVEKQKAAWELLRAYKETWWTRTTLTPTFPKSLSIFYSDEEYFCTEEVMESFVMRHRWVLHWNPSFPTPKDDVAKVKEAVTPLIPNIILINPLNFLINESFDIDALDGADWYWKGLGDPVQKQKAKLQLNAMIKHVTNEIVLDCGNLRALVLDPKGRCLPRPFSSLSPSEKMVVYLLNELLRHQGPNTIFLIDNIDLGLRNKQAQALWFALSHVTASQFIMTGLSEAISAMTGADQGVYL